MKNKEVESKNEGVKGPNDNPQNNNVAPEDGSISVSDIHSCAAIIKLCTSRGTILPEEMEMVGKLYNKLTKFLENQQENK